MRHCLQTASHVLSNGRVFRGIQLVRPYGRRYIRISTIPSGTLDDLPAEAPDISNVVSPGAYYLLPSEKSTDDTSGRCQIRGFRWSEFTPFSLLVGIPKPFHTSRHLNWYWGKSRKCELPRAMANSRLSGHHRLSQRFLCKSPSVEHSLAFHFSIRNYLLLVL